MYISSGNTRISTVKIPFMITGRRMIPAGSLAWLEQ